MRNFICLYTFVFSFLCVQNIKEILLTSSEGREIGGSLETKKNITIKQRRALVRILVSYLIEKFGETWVTVLF